MNGKKVVCLSFLAVALCVNLAAQGPTMLHPNLAARSVVTGLALPTTMAFVNANDFLILEKNSGQVRRVVNGELQADAVLDLSVNNNSERGLLGIALHPAFPANRSVYLFWSCRTTIEPPNGTVLFEPIEQTCQDANMFGLPDSDNVFAAPLLGNRVDRFVWDPVSATLTFAQNLITLRSFQHDGAPEPEGQGDSTQPPRANHDGGVMAFGPDGKLYIIFGDTGRRSQLQNLPSGPTATGLGDPVPDDQFGGPEADDAHFTGVILRLNDDGTTPSDNPFFAAGAGIGGQAGTNIQKIYAYGIRNSFGMAFDPLSGHLWFQENGEDAFDELNRVVAGMNSGWIQFMGPAGRIADYRQIETTALHHEDFPNLQQFRWGPERIAETAAEATSRLFMLPGAQYKDPEFSWKHVVAPSAIGFLNSRALGPQFFGDLFMGIAAFDDPQGGPLVRFNLTGNRLKIGVDEPGLEDRVDDNTTFHEFTESASLVIGRNFGVVTDIKTGPNGNLFVVSLTHGTVYEIHRR